MKNDPFFGDDDHVVILQDREELTDGGGVLTVELRNWLIEQAPGVKFTYRRTMSDPVMNVVFKFAKESEAIHFKMRWQ